jgi:hypothetical protein
MFRFAGSKRITLLRSALHGDCPTSSDNFRALPLSFTSSNGLSIRARFRFSAFVFHLSTFAFSLPPAQEVIR